MYAYGWAPHKGPECIIPAIRTVAKKHNIEIMVIDSNSHHELDTNDYAAQMLRVITSKALRTKMGILSYSRYKERYSVQKMVRNTVRLYESPLPRTFIKI